MTQPTQSEHPMRTEHSMHAMRSQHTMESCIQACDQCHQVCLRTAMNYCLNTGGRHIEPEHFRLMISCAEICQTSANFQLSNTSFSHRLCAVCAEVCEACAADCRRIGGMDECVQACENCAESCRQMATAAQH